jgi:type II secretory pathway pseudopilin PulG
LESILISIALMVGAVYLFWRGLRDTSKSDPGMMIGALLLLALVCLLVGAVSASGGYGGILGFLVTMFTSAAALVAGVFLAALLKGKRKLVSILIGVVFPIALFLSVLAGAGFSPELQSQSYAAVIAAQLDEYRSDKGYYPGALEELVPDYLADLREPKTIWGWLYTATEDTFTLGYVFYVDKLGYSVCIYPSDLRAWDCLTNSTGPFDIPPTPSRS